ncbi:recombinase family protein [Enterobacter hormaechei]|uniref:recombinase family protein n=1 Tax=Enterobacter hormaechei TaxID=158836 RepID=UPI0032DBF0D3
MKLLVSYVRWSTKAQDSGDSLRRQNDMIDAFYRKHSDEYFMQATHRYVDKGKSGFHQKHKADGGEFKRMLDNVLSGDIPAGSLIVMENFDRASRADIDSAIDDIRQILRKDVEILTLGDNEKYDKSSLSDPIRLIKHILIAERAHQESVVKQERTIAVWKAKTEKAKQTGLPMGRQTPGWIELSPDRKTFLVNEARANTVRLIYEMRLAGHSMFAICKHLNENSIETINDRKARISKTFKPGGGGWSAMSVKCLLTSRSVLGYLPAKFSREDRTTILRDEIADYYPRIIDDQTFNAVQTLLAQGGKGRLATGDHWLYVNIFRTMLRCKCGLTMSPSGIRKPVYQGTYRCNGMHEGRCEYGSVSRKKLDTALCTRLFSKLSQLYDSTTDQTKIVDLNRRLQTIDNELQTLTETLLQLPNITQIRDALAEKQREKETIQAELKRETVRIESVMDLDLSKLDLATVQGRTEAHVIIKKMVREITVDGRAKLVDIRLHNGNMIRGFSLEGERDLTLTFEQATDDTPDHDFIAIVGQELPKVFPAEEFQSSIQPDCADWPEVEPDYPNTRE